MEVSRAIFEGRGLCVFGAGPAMGKSVVTAGLLRLLRDAGQSVVPFKVAAVVPADADPEAVTRELAIAARIEPNEAIPPVTVLVTERRLGEVWVDGRSLGTIHLLTEDTPLWGTLPQESLDVVREVVGERLEHLTSRFGAVVIEGSGCVGEAPLEDDLSNLWLAKRSRLGVVLSARQTKGGGPAGLLGASHLVRRATGRTPIGFVLTDVRPYTPVEYATDLMAESDIPLIGTIDFFAKLKGPEKDAVTHEERVRKWSSDLGRTIGP